METRERRRFTIADGMVLVVATAVGLMLAREEIRSLLDRYSPTRKRPITLIHGLTSCLAASWMLALIPLRLKRPRPPWRRLVRQPGFAACVATAAALGYGAIYAGCYAGFKVWPSPSGRPWPFEQLWALGSMKVMPAVVGAWMVLCGSGLCRPERGWIDRLGWVLGGSWIGWTVLFLIRPWIESWIPNF